MKVILDNLELHVSKPSFGQVSIEFDGRIISFADSKSRVVDIIKVNYEKIKAYYISNLAKNKLIEYDVQDLNSIYVIILLFYINQYGKWKKQYEKSNYDIMFYTHDFDHPFTYDLIIWFLKEKYPDAWKSMSANYLDRTQEEFEFYWANRIAYFNK